MTDCIRREAAINKVLEWLNIAKCPYNHSAYNCGEIAAYETCLEDLKSLSSADVRPVVHGEWENAGSDVWKCSRCGYGIMPWNAGVNYCPNCGADMKEEYI